MLFCFPNDMIHLRSWSYSGCGFCLVPRERECDEKSYLEKGI